jgi:hypothetical protein
MARPLYAAKNNNWRTATSQVGLKMPLLLAEVFPIEELIHSGFASWQSYDEWLESGPIVLELNRHVFKDEEIITSYEWSSLSELIHKQVVELPSNPTSKTSSPDVSDALEADDPIKPSSPLISGVMQADDLPATAASSDIDQEDLPAFAPEAETLAASEEIVETSSRPSSPVISGVLIQDDSPTKAPENETKKTEKILQVSEAPEKSQRTSKCGECKEPVPKGYSCDFCSNWMHESCGVNMKPGDSKNSFRRCTAHFPKNSAESEDKPGTRRNRPRMKVVPMKADDPQLRKK